MPLEVIWSYKMFSIGISVFLVATLTAAVLSRLYITLALRKGILDVPNARSSHTIPTPRGGGLAVVLVVLCGLLYIACSSLGSPRLSGLLGIASAAVATIGYWDDRVGISAGKRFTIHLLAAATVATGAVLDTTADLASTWPLLSIVLYTLAIAWSLNLFNFMDGIDGIAGSQAVFVFLASAGLVYGTNAAPFLMLLLVSAGAALGFLVWNWPRAKIFMGDVGSGFLGFWLAALAVVLHTRGVLSIWVSLILSTLFVADATATLIRRFFAGRRWYEAHRSHVYQRFARRWQSHCKVTLLFLALNVSVVLPLAIAAAALPPLAPYLAIGTVASFTALAWVAGAGVEETAN